MTGLIVTVRWLQAQNIRLTWFTLKAWERSSAPASPIRLLWRFSVVSVCENCHYETTADNEHPSNLVHLQCLSKMLRNWSTDLVRPNIQSCKCLWEQSAWDSCRLRNPSHLVDFQCLSKTLGTFCTDTSRVKIQCGECLKCVSGSSLDDLDQRWCTQCQWGDRGMRSGNGRYRE